jgi:hypothetical protein
MLRQERFGGVGATTPCGDVQPVDNINYSNKAAGITRKKLQDFAKCVCPGR